jgi:hypothetical protein
MTAAWAETAGRAAYTHFVRNIRNDMVWDLSEGKPVPAEPAPAWEDLDERAKPAWRNLAAVIAQAEQERIYDQLGHDHFVVFSRDRWTVEHSVECRLSGHMAECDIHSAIAEDPDDYRARAGYGRWRIVLADDGYLDLVQSDAA